MDISKLCIKNSRISDDAVIIATNRAHLSIENSFIGYKTLIAAHQKVQINSHCLIGEMVTIRDQNHGFQEKGKLYNKKGFMSAPVIIEKNVWIGAKATILKGVKVGENSIIGSNAVVTKDLPSNSINVGIPSKTIKYL